jgi:hypothetical protein
MYTRTGKATQNKTRSVAGSHAPRSGRNGQGLWFVDNRAPLPFVIQKMSVKTVDKDSYVIKDKRKNHIGATKTDRDTLAYKKPGDRTMVSSESILTSVVDADPTDLVENGNATLDTSCVLYLYEKDSDPGRNQPASLKIDGVDTNCEIGVHHDSGKDKIAIHHFQIRA